MKIMSSTDFCDKLITESLTNIELNDKFVVLCISTDIEESEEIQHLKNACINCNANFIHANLENTDNFIKIINGYCVLCIGDKMYKLEKNNTIVLKRHAHTQNHNVKKSISILITNDFLIANSGYTTCMCRDKAATYNQLKNANVSQPKTVVLNKDNIKDFDKLMDETNFNYPVIAKVNRGVNGNGVFLFETKQSLKGVSQYILSRGDKIKCNSIIIQEKINSDCVLKIHVLRKESNYIVRNGDTYEVFGGLKQTTIKNDYRSNIHNSEYENYTPKQDEIDIAIQAAKTVKAIWCDVDMMRDSKSGKLYVIEINSTPVLKGGSEIAKNDPTTKFIKSIKTSFLGHNENKPKKEKTLLGYCEIFYIKGLDIPLTALMDSGNATLTSLRVESAVVSKDKKTIKWKMLGKTFKTVYDGDVKFFSSAGTIVTQHTTKIDIIHNNIVYKNIRVKLSDIEGGIKKNRRALNISRDLLKKMNAVVDASLKYVGEK